MFNWISQPFKEAQWYEDIWIFCYQQFIQAYECWNAEQEEKVIWMVFQKWKYLRNRLWMYLGINLVSLVLYLFPTWLPTPCKELLIIMVTTIVSCLAMMLPNMAAITIFGVSLIGSVTCSHWPEFLVLWPKQNKMHVQQDICCFLVRKSFFTPF